MGARYDRRGAGSRGCAFLAIEIEFVPRDRETTPEAIGFDASTGGQIIVAFRLHTTRYNRSPVRALQFELNETFVEIFHSLQPLLALCGGDFFLGKNR